MSNKPTIFQRLTNVLISGSNPSAQNFSTYNLNMPNNEVLFSTHNKEERDQRLATIKQQKLLAYQWAKTGYDTSMEQLQGASQVKIMYRDADLMDAWPEIGAALDILSEESTVINKKGKILNIYSKSERVKSVLEDLFVNRLNIHIMLPMISRAMCKYGNEFLFLNVDATDGIIGWKELPVYDIERVEHGLMNYSNGGINAVTATNVYTLKPDDVKYVWRGHNDSNPYKNWQISHFRLINDSLFLPYGVSHLNKARRHWRMLSMMEDAMLLYRLDRSVERRVFKVNVGAIDDADVPAFLNDFMNNVKRAPVIDSKTGQIDLKKNFLDVSADYVIPVRPGSESSDITNLQPAQNQTSMDDITYMENKVLSALKVPKTFLNFDGKDSKAQNMASIDIRFSRVVNKIQQALLMELNKIAIIHLYLKGFEDDITNFSLSLNNPSNQLEMLELDNTTKKIGAATSALSEMGGGIPLMSWHQVQKEIMGKTDKEIFDMLNEIRLEKAMAGELENTGQIITKTGMFNNVDRIYGDVNAQATNSNSSGNEGGGMGGGGGMPPSGGFGDMDFSGGDLGDLGEPGADEMGEIGGDESSEPMDENMPMENIFNINGREVLNEKSHFDVYSNYIKSLYETEEEDSAIFNRLKILNEEMEKSLKECKNKKE